MCNGGDYTFVAGVSAVTYSGYMSLSDGHMY